jgi:hypothetical protein
MRAPGPSGVIKTGAVAVALLYVVLVRSAAAEGNYLLTAEIPATIRKGVPATLVLHVHGGAQPVDRLVPCLATAPLFVSMEDALDTTPANGIDLGVGPESSLQPACITSIAGVSSGPGVYVFTWEPDTAGRVNLKFTAGASALTVPADVDSAPPSPLILAIFVVFVALVLSAAAYVRHRWPEAAAP